MCPVKRKLRENKTAACYSHPIDTHDAFVRALH